MKTIKLKYLCLSILICVFVLNLLMTVSRAQTIPGVQRLEEGIAAYERGEYDDAIFKLEMAVYQIGAEDKDQLWDAQFYLGLSYHLTGKDEEARKQFSKTQGIYKNKSPDSDVFSPKFVKLFKEIKSKRKQGVQTPVTIPLRIKLRSSYSDLSTSQVQSMPNISIREKSGWGYSGYSTIIHSYEKKSINGDKVVIDHVTGLMWHQSGSDKDIRWNKAKEWIRNINIREFAGYNDWRLPTVEEAASLLEFSEENGLYIDPLFSNVQRYVWTGDKYRSDTAWNVRFSSGRVYWSYLGTLIFVRPVRSVK
jgi:hypothetical protein